MGKGEKNWGIFFFFAYCHLTDDRWRACPFHPHNNPLIFFFTLPSGQLFNVVVDSLVPFSFGQTHLADVIPGAVPQGVVTETGGIG